MDIKEIYGIIEKEKKLDQDFAVIFVYNEKNLINDKIHASECITSIEKEMIINSFRKSVRFVYSISSEKQFIEKIGVIKSKHKNIFVYSMAQDIYGTGRRSLIPLLCDYYNLNSPYFISRGISG